MKKYSLLLADADGTLLDFEKAETNALRLAAEAMGVQLTDARAARYSEINASLWRRFERGEVSQQALRLLRFSMFLEEIGEALDAERMAEAFTDALSLQADEIAGAREFLREASARVPVVIVTNGIASVQRGRFARSPLSAFVKGFVISGEVGFAKPDPRMITRALEMGGFPANEALMLGDEPRSDIAAANAADVDSCWFNPSGCANATEHVPTYEIRSLSEALAWL